MGLPGQDDHPTVPQEGWVHCLTVPRELSLKGLALYQDLLLPELEPGVMRKELGANSVRIDIRPNISLEWDGEVLTLDREGDSRVVKAEPGELVIADDNTAIEITAGDGQISFALRAF